MEEGGDIGMKNFGRVCCNWNEFCYFYDHFIYSIDFVTFKFQSGEKIIMNFTFDCGTVLAILISKNHDIELVPFLEMQERLCAPADSEPQESSAPSMIKYQESSVPSMASSMIKHFEKLDNAYRVSAAKKKKELRTPEKSHLNIIREYKSYNSEDEEFVKLVIELDFKISEASDVETIADVLPGSYWYGGFNISIYEDEEKSVSLYSLDACRSYCHSHGLSGAYSLSFLMKGNNIDTTVCIDIGGKGVELFYRSDATDRNKLLELIDSVMECVYEDKVNNDN